MKPSIVLPMLFTFMFFQLAGAAEQCAPLFSTSTAEVITENVKSEALLKQTLKMMVAVETNSSRTEMYKVSEDGSPSRLKIEIQDFSKSADEDVLELMRLLVNGTSYALENKNILLKNKITLGIPLNQGFTFLVNYESKSTTHPRFVIEDKITLLSPTNKEFRVTDGLLGPVDLALSRAEFDMPDYFEKDSLIKLKIPLVLESNILAKLARYSKYFEHIPKEELRKILAIESPTRRKALLEIGRAKSMFKEAVLKSPFKILAQSVFMGLIISGSNQFFPSHDNKSSFKLINSRPASIVELASPKSFFTAEEALAKAQFDSLRKAAQQYLSKQESLVQSEKMSDLVKSGGTAFTMNANTFIFEKLDPMNNSLHTYIVFSEENILNQIETLQYFVMEINAVRYAAMIKAIKDHQQLK